MSQYALNSILVCTLLPLLFSLALTACVPTLTARQEVEDEQSAQRGKLIHFFLHIVGVVLAGIASATRVSYPPSIRMDYIMIFSFYTCVLGFLAISVYVTYEFESPDMLLIGAAAGVIVAWRSIPRLWSITACKLHWEAPMWRIRDGEIYRRVRKDRPENAEEYWNGYRYNAKLIDGKAIFELAEKEPYHWEHSVSHWKDFIVRGRLGDEPAKRAALAGRMAYTIPLPASIPCGKSEHYASKGALGVEVARTWDIKHHDMSKYNTLSHTGKRKLIECNCRHELAILLHLKMLLYQDKHRKADWIEFATEWLFGELLTSPAPWDNVLACGKVSSEDSLHWNFIARSDKRITDYEAGNV